MREKKLFLRQKAHLHHSEKFKITRGHPFLISFLPVLDTGSKKGEKQQSFQSEKEWFSKLTKTGGKLQGRGKDSLFPSPV